jgi:hypothetical protein
LKPIGRILTLFFLGMLVAVALGVALSPYGKHEGFGYPLLEHTVEIEAAPDSVFRYLGNSGNARKWSVFVHHIAPLNADSVPDGAVGARRRCFCKADGNGPRWDETILETVPGRKRRLSCYAFVNFPVSADGIATEQIYAPAGEGRTRLTFTVFFLGARPSLRDRFLMYLAAYRIKKIFAGNMANIKRLVETGA